MTVIATASNPRFSVSRVDVDRPGPTFTIDTLRDIAVGYGPETELYFITGADALAQILSWRTPRNCSRSPISSAAPAPAHPAGPGPAERQGQPGRGPGAVDLVVGVPRPGGRVSPSGTWSPTASSSTSASGVFTDRAAMKPKSTPTGGHSGISIPVMEEQTRIVTASERSIQLMPVAAEAAADKLADDILAYDVSDRLVITDAFARAPPPTTARSAPSSTRSRSACATRPRPSPSAARANREGRWVLCSTTSTSWSTSSTRRSATSTAWSGSGRTARPSRCSRASPRRPPNWSAEVRVSRQDRLPPARQTAWNAEHRFEVHTTSRSTDRVA